ncbi:MAG TPA: arylsulfotransferase family protein [Thermoleophilaceae bacterium]|nr:arylsulfotransferase family protein [Thermoleophilaceae bacterium]
MRTYRAVFALVLACLIVCAAPGAAAAQQEGVASYASAPKLTPPLLTVNRSSRGQAPGLIFAAVFQNKFFQGVPLVGQGGPMIIDSKGHYVWLKPASKTAPDTLNLQVQRYQGKPVLTYWDGTVTNTGEMLGTWHVLNDRYKEIAKIAPVTDGWQPSAHEFLITKSGTALTTGYKYVPHRDLTAVGGGSDQTLLDSGLVEFDVKTGKLVRAWSADEHIPMTDSYMPANPNNPNAYDPWHINSIDVDKDGNWLVSMRNTWAIYKINPTTGAIIWTLGGKHSSFAVPDNVAFAFQHDARWQPNGDLSIFDNDCCAFVPQPSGPPKTAPPVHGAQSRGMEIKLDENAKTVSLVTENKLYDLISGTQGNRQLLANGNVMLGWGQQPFFSEFSKAGKLLLSVRFPDPDESYRVYRYSWKGNPGARPAAAARPSGSGTRVYASWNGATELAAWRIWAGPTSRKLKVVAKRVARGGFETAKKIRSAGPIVKVQALNGKGRVIGTSRAVRRQNTSGTEPAPTY